MAVKFGVEEPNYTVSQKTSHLYNLL